MKPNTRNSSASPMREEVEASLNDDETKNRTKPNKKGHTKFKPKIHQGTPYLLANIEPLASNNERFVCKPCKASFSNHFDGFCENLRVHLLNKQRNKTIKTKDEQDEVAKAIKHLEREDLILVDSSQSVPILKDQDQQPRPNISGEQKPNQDISLKFDLVCFLIKNDLSFNICHTLLSFIQSLIKKYDPEKIERATINNHQITRVARECIGTMLQKDLLSKLTKSPFSLAMDEGSDKLGKAYLSLSVRYFQDEASNEPETKFLALIEMGESSTGEVLYEKINKILFSGKDAEFIKKKFLGTCSDHAKNMISDKDKGVH